jgi:hypothetical protein
MMTNPVISALREAASVTGLFIPRFSTGPLIGIPSGSRSTL